MHIISIEIQRVGSTEVYGYFGIIISLPFMALKIDTYLTNCSVFHTLSTIFHK